MAADDGENGVQRPPRHWGRMLLILLAGLVLVGGLLYALGAPRTPQEVERAVELELTLL